MMRRQHPFNACRGHSVELILFCALLQTKMTSLARERKMLPVSMPAAVIVTMKKACAAEMDHEGT